MDTEEGLAEKDPDVKKCFGILEKLEGEERERVRGSSISSGVGRFVVAPGGGRREREGVPLS